jgi:hypothetical protein
MLGLSLAPAAPALIPAPDVSMPAGIDLWLDVGDIGTLEGVEYRVLGVVARCTTRDESRDEEDIARWQDYLMYNARIGLRWLSVADGHWSYASPVEPGSALHELGGEALGVFLAADQSLHTRLEWAAGELPWSADIGELAFVREAGDVVLEWTFRDVSASKVRELTPDEVARAFRKRTLPRPK